MKIIDIINSGKPTLSFEVFPPKTSDAYESIQAAVEKIAALQPTFMSVTCGAGGGAGTYTIPIASRVQEQFEVPVLAHLTCVNSSRDAVVEQLAQLRDHNIENILALRGDIAPDAKKRGEWDYHYASELITQIHEFGDFCVGGACYPEGHVESKYQADDLFHLKQKVEAGCDFLTTQMFFDNNILYNFLYKVRESGITVPVVPGIMPVTNASQIKRIIALSGTALPQRFRHILDKFGNNPATMKQAGIAYATEQIVDLFANGIPAVHVYSMNNPSVAESILTNLSEILA
jgi:methylenetetrahydrofolate reductase (NADPH)